MSSNKKIKSALISVFYKNNIDKIVNKLHDLGVKIYSTGGTQSFIEGLGIKVTAVEDLTGYPSILGGRVKTLHPKVFGGILNRRSNEKDHYQVLEYQIPEIDLVIVDLYPFEETVASGASEEDIIEKIDIGGISLIRAAAKNFEDVVIISSRDQYSQLLDLLNQKNGTTDIEDRKSFAIEAFNTSSHYDSAIYNHLAQNSPQKSFKASIAQSKTLRYGENPHQKGVFYGNIEEILEQLHGREISYNNILDIDAAINLIADFDDTTCAILKHNNACGIASDNNLTSAWIKALAGDPVSAFGGVIIVNKPIDNEIATEIDKIFFEIIIAPAYSADALETLKKKKNRIILIQKQQPTAQKQFRTVLNGVIEQDKDLKVEQTTDLQVITNKAPENNQISDLLFANKIVKHTKSNAIVLVKNKQLCASGVGQTSRVDALKQAIDKARSFNFDLNGAVMASDAFFPFPDCVEIADKAGITAVIQPGGSVNDSKSVDYCNNHNMAMVTTGHRHFKH